MNTAMNDLEDFAHLLRDPQAILQDLEETHVQLHSAVGATARAGLTFGVHVPKPGGADAKAHLTLASKRLTDQKTLIKSFGDATEEKRLEMHQTARLQLFSIIFDHYRPGPAFRSSQTWLPGAFSARTIPGGPTWDSILSGKPVAQWARHAARLDNDAAGHRGSGTVMDDGRIVTAKHVITSPGFLFGSPPSPTAIATARLNRVVNGADVNLTVSGFAPLPAEDYCWINAADQWPADLAGTDFAALSGLPIRKTEIKKEDLSGRMVAIIGHPAAPRPNEEALAIRVYGETDMKLGYKRLMPGLLDPDAPLIDDNGLEFLRHDCSTVAGASGSCLIDLETGEILGVHVSGKSANGTEDRNRAVPAWVVNLP